MSLAALINAVRNIDRGPATGYEANNDKLLLRFYDVLMRTWHLGFTSFGGPPVHFRIFYQRFVEGLGGKTPWIDEQTYQELFALCQALPGPGSTKMLFCMALIHAGFLPAIVTLLAWSLPGAVGMFGLSLGVQRLDELLPDIVYALLSGLNASTVGIIALAAVQLAEKSIKDNITRILVIGGACAGLCYNALWYFPTLMVIGGCSTAVWDLYGRRNVAKLRRKLRRQDRAAELNTEEGTAQTSIPLQQASTTTGVQRRTVSKDDDAPDTSERHPGPPTSFIAILVVRGTMDKPPLELDLFTNMYLAGTIIFGGGPVVIPLLREYVVEPGWVSPRDFLIGLAIIQAFPGPNFNFAVFLGALAVISTSSPTILGAFLGYIGIFLPGISLAVGFQSCWRVIRKYPITTSVLRGMNSTAVGLVFTAVYRLWEIGYLSSDASSGQSLGKEPFWLVVAALTYAENAWFNVPPAIAIIFGGILGLCWYGAVGR
ncbi:Chromate transporter family protein [Coccidioides posadasii C735 delta SOWgp]|uniref:Chromate transporter family protein n=1 Tax=Coccidioides posadasii (strain C735) TaxID=222929 RepID=C5P188_COCP7|nr:Chromate transporter family protein [Coccidioides posadasii C735 delta SOWgp]EER29446.1 Chromate transporter family protein [Coccidioides posadasii C735 delta SOWgp]|eukprot:XP_003071591.1 Chromate transporter family protein [Coccidioides posadasii C735 delta SOWgp]